MKRAVPIAAAVALALLTAVLYRKVLRLWWNYDDFHLLHLVIDHQVLASFHDGAVWPQKLFTPLLLVAFEGQFVAFGLDPRSWFVVHLGVMAAAAIALFFALRLYFALLASFAGAVLFVAAVPLPALVTQLSGVHYPLAIFFGALAVITYVAALRRESIALSIVSAVFYLLAMLAKETIVPLLFLLPFLPERRLRLAIPHAITLVVYLCWRYAVIGTILGGYGWAVRAGDWPMLIATLPKKIALACAGVHLPIGILLLVIMAIGIALAVAPHLASAPFLPAGREKGKRRAVALFLVAMALAVGPIIPVSPEMQRRFALMPWLVASIAFVAGARNRKTLLLLGVVVAIVANRQEFAAEYAKVRRMSDEARVFFDLPVNGLLRHPTVPPAAMGELQWLKTVHAQRPAGAAWFYDDLWLCGRDVADKRMWSFDPARREVLEKTEQLPVIARQHCAAIRHDAPLSAAFDYSKGSLFWTFGPHRDGRWRVLLGDGVQSFDVPRQGGFRLPEVPGLTLRVRYDAPGGWTTYSPELPLDFQRRPQTTWRR